MVGGRPGLTQTSLLSRILNVDSNLYISTNAYVVGAQKDRLNLREREREREFFCDRKQRLESVCYPA